MLGVIMLNVVMLSVVAPFRQSLNEEKVLLHCQSSQSRNKDAGNLILGLSYKLFPHFILM
jgi:hypothetical protein